MCLCEGMPEGQKIAGQFAHDFIYIYTRVYTALGFSIMF